MLLGVFLKFISLLLLIVIPLFSETADFQKYYQEADSITHYINNKIVLTLEYNDVNLYDTKKKKVIHNTEYIENDKTIPMVNTNFLVLKNHDIFRVIRYSLLLKLDTKSNVIYGTILNIEDGNSSEIFKFMEGKKYTPYGEYTTEDEKEDVYQRNRIILLILLLIWIISALVIAYIKTEHESGISRFFRFGFLFLSYTIGLVIYLVIFILSSDKNANSSSSRPTSNQKNDKYISHVIHRNGKAVVSLKTASGGTSGFSISCDEVLNWTDKTVTIKRYSPTDRRSYSIQVIGIDQNVISGESVSGGS
jgi:hypothetical protein